MSQVTVDFTGCGHWVRITSLGKMKSPHEKFALNHDESFQILLVVQ